ncbi:hypothetical protein C8R43DRAFT_1135155 [Mycena crocata]|nr:hypothetical protein C8R43DRAFT_1135155 [Mycena crocata]
MTMTNSTSAPISAEEAALVADLEACKAAVEKMKYSNLDRAQKDEVLQRLTMADVALNQYRALQRAMRGEYKAGDENWMGKRAEPKVVEEVDTEFDEDDTDEEDGPIQPPVRVKTPIYTWGADGKMFLREQEAEYVPREHTPSPPPPPVVSRSAPAVNTFVSQRAAAPVPVEIGNAHGARAIPHAPQPRRLTGFDASRLVDEHAPEQQPPTFERATAAVFERKAATAQAAQYSAGPDVQKSVGGVFEAYSNTSGLATASAPAFQHQPPPPTAKFQHSPPTGNFQNPPPSESVFKHHHPPPIFQNTSSSSVFQNPAPQAPSPVMFQHPPPSAFAPPPGPIPQQQQFQQPSWGKFGSMPSRHVPHEAGMHMDGMAASASGYTHAQDKGMSDVQANVYPQTRRVYNTYFQQQGSMYAPPGVPFVNPMPSAFSFAKPAPTQNQNSFFATPPQQQKQDASIVVYPQQEQLQQNAYAPAFGIPSDFSFAQQPETWSSSQTQQQYTSAHSHSQPGLFAPQSTCFVPQLQFTPPQQVPSNPHPQSQPPSEFASHPPNTNEFELAEAGRRVREAAFAAALEEIVSGMYLSGVPLAFASHQQTYPSSHDHQPQTYQQPAPTVSLLYGPGGCPERREVVEVVYVEPASSVEEFVAFASAQEGEVVDPIVEEVVDSPVKEMYDSEKEEQREYEPWHTLPPSWRTPAPAPARPPPPPSWREIHIGHQQGASTVYETTYEPTRRAEEAEAFSAVGRAISAHWTYGYMRAGRSAYRPFSCIAPRSISTGYSSSEDGGSEYESASESEAESDELGHGIEHPRALGFSRLLGALAAGAVGAWLFAWV